MNKMASNKPETSDSTNFREEISKMMYGFGDSSSPDPETVLLIESIVLKQQRSVLQDAHEISVTRGANRISNYELIYLMGKNKNVLKLKRLYDFQLSQDEFEKIQALAKINFLISQGCLHTESIYEEEKTRQRSHIKVMEKLGAIKKVLKINHDYLGYLRKLRADTATHTMSAGEYKPFQEARCITFHTNPVYKDGLSKFKRWVDPDRKYKFTHSGLEVLCFIAHETVADIIEAVLLARKGNVIGQNCGFSTLELNNGVKLRWAINVTEVNLVLEKYFTPNYWLNSLFFKNMGLEYLTGHA